MSERCIENYLKYNEYVCREERQYVLLLNNLLLKEESWNIVKEYIGIPKDAQFKHVFYEAAIMRDFHHGNPKGEDEIIIDKEKRNYFNKKLLEFGYGCEIADRMNDVLNTKNKNKSLLNSQVDFGNNPEVLDELRKTFKEYLKEKNVTEKDAIIINDIIKKMMSIKFDLLILYSEKNKENDEKLHALAIECKYESEEGTYTLEPTKIKTNFQLAIQAATMKFLFEDKEENNEIHILNNGGKAKETKEKYVDCINNMGSDGWKSYFDNVINEGVQVIRFGKEEIQDYRKTLNRQKNSNEEMHDYRKTSIEYKNRDEERYIPINYLFNYKRLEDLLKEEKEKKEKR